MRDFDPHRIASEWHSGQSSALYAYCSTDRIPTEEFKERLVSEIEHSMAGANDEGLDELEYLLMHVEEQHPDQYPNPGMHEAWATVNKHGEEEWSDDDDADIRDLYLSPEAFNDSSLDEICKVCGSVGCDCIVAKPKAKREEDAFCEICGGNEGVCECAMTEGEPSSYDYDDREMDLDTKRSQAAGRARHDARLPIDDPRRVHSPIEETDGTECPECNGPAGKHDSKCPLKNESKSSLRTAVFRIMKEMKLGIAGRGSFDFGAKDDADDDFVTSFLLAKKDKEAEKETPAPEKSGTQLKTTKKRSKSSQFR